jgi:thymidylate synthase (FAD)
MTDDDDSDIDDSDIDDSDIDDSDIDCEYTTCLPVQVDVASGCDDDIVRAALVLPSGADHGKDVGRFIRMLMRSRHGTPFEHTFFRFVVKAPIFVLREWQRHRIGWSYSEISARYRQLEPEFWMPSLGRPIHEPEEFNPMRPELERDDALVEETIQVLSATYQAVWAAYQHLLSRGVAREVARAVLPVGIYSQMVCSCNVRSLLHFLSLRTHKLSARYPSYPQYEIEQCAKLIEAAFRERFPHTHAAFEECGRVAP